jgi:hypothetical protein
MLNMRTILIITFHWLPVQLLQEESLALPDLSPVPCKPRAVCFLPITESSEPPNVFSTKPPETITFSFTKLYYFPVFTDRCPRPTCPSPLRPLRSFLLDCISFWLITNTFPFYSVCILKVSCVVSATEDSQSKHSQNRRFDDVRRWRGIW